MWRVIPKGPFFVAACMLTHYASAMPATHGQETRRITAVGGWTLALSGGSFIHHPGSVMPHADVGGVRDLHIHSRKGQIRLHRFDLTSAATPEQRTKLASGEVSHNGATFHVLESPKGVKLAFGG